MKNQGQVYNDIEKEINNNQNRFSDNVKDAFWRFFYLFSNRKFRFKGKDYNYFYHPYNKTWRNERAVEIPVCKDILSEYSNKKILEVGNVLSHYIQSSHVILDKYEKGTNIINEDIIKFHSDTKFDLIISISTIEHVGWDEAIRDPEKPWEAIENLKSMLKPGGKLLVTIPLGYNSDLENLIANKRINFSDVQYLKRISSDKKSLLSKSPSYNNFWKEVAANEIKDTNYNSPFPHANAILIGTIFN